MKKVLFTIALAAFAMAANAQFIVGGSLRINHNGGTDRTDAWTTPTTNEQIVRTDAVTTINFNPKVGYKLADNMQAGLQLQIGYNYGRNYNTWAYTGDDNSDQYTSRNYMTIGLAPYFRYYVTEFGKFNLFCEAEAAFAMRTKGSNYNSVTGNTVDGNTSRTSFDLSIVPGLNYALNDNFSIDIYLNMARFGWNITKVSTDNSSINQPNETSTTHRFGLNVNADAQNMLDSDIDIDMATPSMNLNGLLTSIAVGFNYHF